MPKPAAVLIVCALAVLSAPALAQIGVVKPIPTSRSIGGTWVSSRGSVTLELGGAGYIGTVPAGVRGRHLRGPADHLRRAGGRRRAVERVERRGREAVRRAVDLPGRHA